MTAVSSAGRFVVERWSSRWTVTDMAEPHRDGPRFDSEAAARAFADRRNRVGQPSGQGALFGGDQ